VTAGGLVFLGGSDGIVRALDAATGKGKWIACTGGAVLCPPTVAAGRVFAGSADGRAYALEAATGKVLWSFRAAPVERRIFVYGRLISAWPVGGGVLVEGATAYFGAGINDFDGTHVYAVDAATGKIKWQNNTCGHLDAESRRGVMCQGEMLIHNNTLFMAGGNVISPGMFDLKTGKCLNKTPTSFGTRAPRGRELAIENNRVTVSGQPLYSDPRHPVFDKSCKWRDVEVKANNCKLRFERRENGWFVVARSHDNKRQLWAQPLPAEPVRWGIAAGPGGRVFVTLRGGRVICFGKAE
jgi:outer membrane protein assembly factor BamB